MAVRHPSQFATLHLTRCLSALGDRAESRERPRDAPPRRLQVLLQGQGGQPPLQQADHALPLQGETFVHHH